VFTKLTRVTRKGFYTGSADHVPKEKVNKNVGSSWLHKSGMCQHTFIINLKAFKY